MEGTVCEDCLIKRHAIELAVCYPYGVDISAGEGTVAERATGETRTFQIRAIKGNFIKNTLDKNRRIL